LSRASHPDRRATVELVIENRRRNPSLPWDAFPPTLSAQIDEYLSARANDDLRFDVSPVVFRPETVKSKRLQLRQYVTALVESGVAPQNLSTLADLVAPHHVRAGLHVLYKRAGDTKTTRMYSMATLLLGLARHQVKAEPETIKQLAVYCANVCPKKTGMVDKNRERLRPFKDPRQLDIFLALPGRLLTAARALAEPTKAEARLAQHAIALEIFTVAPLRISNIAALEVGRTLILTETTGHIVVPRAEVKNAIDIEIPLPRTTLKMIKLYLKRFHPLLAPLGCAMLFPSADGGHKRSPVLGTQLRQRIRGECGLDFNAHLFRHLAAYIFLRENPGQYGTVKLLLGHKDIDTTINTYCGLEADAAFASYASIIGARRAAVQGDWA
jgi:integrase